MSFKKMLIVAALAVGGISMTNTGAKAQYDYPGYGGLADIASMNAQFDANFDVYARQMSWKLAQEIPNDQPLPFNAMTISQSISAGNASFQGYIDNSVNNSNAALNAADRWDVGAVQGGWAYQPQGGGQPVILPYTTNPTNGYVNQSGTYYPGYAPGGNNYVQMGYNW